ncbi:hypothetical protein [Nocardia nova]|uniref:hypothetical protein n=1 Tax=Nocardia nova TaxID=37330 RepID=UPI0011B01E0C|nr:hypothetical protein [Nocardia nova]
MASQTVDATRPAVHLRIGAERIETGPGGVHQHINAVDGRVDARVDAQIPLAGPAEVDRAARTAHEAFAGPPSGVRC